MNQEEIENSPQQKRLVRDSMGILLNELRELEKAINEDADGDEGESVALKSIAQLDDLAKLHIDSWTPEHIKGLLEILLAQSLHREVSGIAVKCVMIHRETGIPLSKIGEGLFKKACKLWP
jgi:DNA primase catalytic subunit